MPIYTKKGDKANTATIARRCIQKYNIHAEVLGTLDELNSNVGYLSSLIDQTNIDNKKDLFKVMKDIQKSLMGIASEIAGAKSRINGAKTVELEELIDKYQEDLPELNNFVVPSGTSEVTYAHVVRTVCRRAERLVSKLNSKTPINPAILTYLNRLSDLLFVISRELIRKQGGVDQVWSTKTQI